MMRKITSMLAGALTLLLGVGAGTVGAQAAEVAQPAGYPSKPINIVIPFAAGGGSDILARVIVSMDNEYFKTNMIPVIKPGASGTVGTDYVAHSKPDGYTLLLGAPHMITVFPQVPGKKVNYDPLKMVPVSLLNASNSVCLTPKERPWSNWKEFVAYGKKNPGKLSYGSSGAWGITHVRTAAIFKKLGIDAVHVPYSGGNEMTQAVMRGEVDFAMGSPSHALAVYRSGEAQVLAFMMGRYKGLPDIPSFEDLNIDIRMPTWRGVFAPPGTSPEIVAWLDQQFGKLVKDKVFKRFMSKLGEDIVYKPAPEFKAMIAKEYKDYREVIETIAALEQQKKK